MDYDDDLWGPPSFDVIEENYLNEKYCEQAWQILNNKKKPDAELQKNSDSVSASAARDPITTMTLSFEPRSKRQKMNETKESFNGTELGSKICQETTTEEGVVSPILFAEETRREEKRKDEWKNLSGSGESCATVEAEEAQRLGF